MTKPGSNEFRLRNVDGCAVVDVGQPNRFGGRLGPGWRSEKWGGRGWMSVTGHGVSVNKPGRLTPHAKHGEVYECECVRRVRGMNRAERHFVIPGSTEYQIEWDTLADVPDTGYVDLALEFSGSLVWHKQLSLTPQEIDFGVSRPDNVINSYAVYGSQNGRFLRVDGTEHVNFETGKFCHLYRPRLVDAKGRGCWLDQTAPIAGPNRLRVHLDDDWLAGAAFPVVLDPVFGYDSVGATTNVTADWAFAAGPHQPSVDCLATAVTMYTKKSSSDVGVTFGIYDHTATRPNSLLRDSAGATINSTTPGWVSASLDSGVSLTAGSNYYLANATANAGYYSYYYDSVAGFSWFYKSNTYSAGVLPASWVVSNALNSWKESIYATYEEAASGKPWHVYAQQ
jgi:hypothetical protein